MVPLPLSNSVNFWTISLLPEFAPSTLATLNEISPVIDKGVFFETNVCVSIEKADRFSVIFFYRTLGLILTIEFVIFSKAA